MSCNCNNANPNCEPCAFCTPPGVTGLTTCQPIDPCEDKPNVDCVYYNGTGCESLGIQTGDSLTSVLQALLAYYIDPANDCCDLDGEVEFITTTTSTSTSTTTTSTTTTTTLPPECSYYEVNNNGPRYPGATIEYYPCNCIYPQQVTITDSAVTICVDNAHPITVLSGTINPPVNFGPCTLTACTTSTTTTQAPCNCKIYLVENLSRTYSYDLDYIDCSLGVPGVSTNISVQANTSIQICACDTLEEVFIPNVIHIINTENDCYGPPTTSTTTIACTISGGTGTLLESFTMAADKVTEIKLQYIESSTNFVINWGDGVVTPYLANSYYQSISHTYTTPYSGNITFYSTNLSGITQFKDADDSSTTSPWQGFNCSNGGSLSVTTNELNKLDSCEQLELRNIKTTGDIFYLPSTLERIIIWGNGRPNSANCSNTLSGNIINIPPDANFITILGQNTLTGDLNDLPTPSGITVIGVGYSLEIRGLNTIYGYISDLPTGSPISQNTIRITGNNTITGDIATLPSDYIRFEIAGGTDSNHTDMYGNTIYGDLADFPSQLCEFILKGDNILTGDLADVSASTLTIFYLRGRSTVYGDINDIDAPYLLNLTLIDDLSLTNVSGNIGYFGSNFSNVTTFQIIGSQTITGNINGLPPTLESFILNSSNSSLTGNWSTLSTHINLYQFVNLLGYSKITGNLGLLPSSVKVFNYETTDVLGVSTYTSGHIWANPMQMFNYVGGIPMSTVSINNLLVGLATVSSWAVVSGSYSTAKTIKLKGTATGAGLAAIPTLTGYGVTVTIIP